MKIIRVTYKVQEDFAERNKSNIQAVMTALKNLNNRGNKYASFLEPDGTSFMHFAMYPDDTTGKIVNDLPEFVHFRNELKASQPEQPPKAVDLSLVASAYDIFQA